MLGDERGDLLFGGKGDDSLAGFGGDDLLQGGKGNDTRQGSAGHDTVDGGGTGADLLVVTWGGTVDHYDGGLTDARREVVSDFVAGEDQIRLVESALATITLIGSAACDATNQVRWVSSGGNTTVFINGDDDLAADMAITLIGVTGLVAGDSQLG